MENAGDIYFSIRIDYLEKEKRDFYINLMKEEINKIIERQTNFIAKLHLLISSADRIRGE